MNKRPAPKKLQESPKVSNGGLGHRTPSPQPLGPISTRNGEKPPTQPIHPDQDIEFSCAANIPPLIPEGKYEVVFLRAEKKKLWGREKVFLWFQIMSSGKWHEEQLYMACNGPKNGKWTLSCKFYQAWVLAAGRRPERFDRMSTKVFRGKVFLAQVRDVTTNAQKVARSPLCGTR